MHSVFFRLLAVIVIVAISLTMISLAGFIYLRHNIWTSMGNNMLRYTRYLAADIGQPPDRQRAAAIAQDTQMTIRYTSPTQNWTIPPGSSIPDVSKHYRRWYRQNNTIAGSSRRGHFIRFTNEDGELLFWLDRNRGAEKEAGRGLLIFHVAVLIILLGAYLYIRRVMQPIHWLTATMEQFAGGNLAYRMPLKRQDEFQSLAEAMNNMAAQIQALIQSKDVLLLDVSHELRSPLARLKVGLEMLPESEVKSSLREDLNEMEAMVTEILSAYRFQRVADQLTLEKVDILPLIQAVAAEFSDRAPGIRVMASAGTGLTLDIKKIRVVLRNVIDNALKYSGKSAQPVEIHSTREKRSFQIKIVDHGIGIPEDLRQRVFEPFFRVDPSRSRQTGGFGLGLSMCKAIIDAHGGSIEINGNQNGGTVVTIRLPLSI